MSYKTGALKAIPRSAWRPLLFFLVLAVVCGSALPGNGSLAWAMDDWKLEFNTVCGQTQNALSFSTDELNSLIGRCDKLKPRIEKLDSSRSSERKVFLQRLKMCRQFYAFVLGTKAEQD